MCCSGCGYRLLGVRGRGGVSVSGEPLACLRHGGGACVGGESLAWLGVRGYCFFVCPCVCVCVAHSWTLKARVSVLLMALTTQETAAKEALQAAHAAMEVGVRGAWRCQRQLGWAPAPSML